MKARRSQPGRTDARLARGPRRTHSATALLLSFALLCTAVSLGTSGPHGHRGSLSLRSSASRTIADQGAVPSPADAAARSLGRLSREPRPAHPRVRPHRSVAAVSQEAATARLLAVVPVAFPVAETTTTGERVSADSPSSFLAYASATSRTRGQPVQGS